MHNTAIMSELPSKMKALRYVSPIGALAPTPLPPSHIPITHHPAQHNSAFPGEERKEKTTTVLARTTPHLTPSTPIHPY
jgi:hypothetical protein